MIFKSDYAYEYKTQVAMGFYFQAKPKKQKDCRIMQTILPKFPVPTANIGDKKINISISPQIFKLKSDKQSKVTLIGPSLEFCIGTIP